ncbi:DUF2867 domain-containing protein [Actinomadura sp. 6K520]|uniref:DUF2867 domain-containing protein n=1 Tax=Actinomadura sp. 6K520 TaxID=2530364 RepID=UPI00104754FF|nr:DUF2867 domain-containing protein [Actinomadura sp. 6K520]TDE32950.1 DUF2867 domain-containing protein [Actinomadura sp. 6K520]
MKVALTEHTARPWRIHEIAYDFELEDVWALPTPGGPGDFELLASELATSGRPGEDATGIPRLLWAVRWKLGEILGWDREDAGLRARVPTLRDRLPDDLREAASPELGGLPFSPLYKLDDELAAELANATVHAVLHLSWVEDGNGGHRGQMAVLVKPNGLFGRLYMAAIKPFRYLFVYPALMRDYERWWQRATSGRGPAAGQVASAVGLHRIPESMRGRLDADYADIFTLATDVTATPEHCARTMLESVAGAGGQRIWRRLLGLRLAPRPWTETVAGWRVAERGEHWIRLRARSWMLTFDLVVRVEESTITLVTLGRYDRTLGKIVWSLASRFHRRAAADLLRETAARLQAGNR